MRYEIGFGVGFDQDGNALSAYHVNECVKMILVEACRHFGGCNLITGQGAWLNGKGDLVVEESRTLIIDASRTGRLVSDLEADAKGLAEFIRKLLNQESVHFVQLAATSHNLNRSLV